MICTAMLVAAVWEWVLQCHLLPRASVARSHVAALPVREIVASHNLFGRRRPCPMHHGPAPICSCHQQRRPWRWHWHWLWRCITSWGRAFRACLPLTLRLHRGCFCLLLLLLLQRSLVLFITLSLQLPLILLQKLTLLQDTLSTLLLLLLLSLRCQAISQLLPLCLKLLFVSQHFFFQLTQALLCTTTICRICCICFHTLSHQQALTMTQQLGRCEESSRL